MNKTSLLDKVKTHADFVHFSKFYPTFFNFVHFQYCHAILIENVNLISHSTLKITEKARAMIDAHCRDPLSLRRDRLSLTVSTTQ